MFQLEFQTGTIVLSMWMKQKPYPHYLQNKLLKYKIGWVFPTDLYCLLLIFPFFAQPDDTPHQQKDRLLQLLALEC